MPPPSRRRSSLLGHVQAFGFVATVAIFLQGQFQFLDFVGMPRDLAPKRPSSARARQNLGGYAGEARGGGIAVHATAESDATMELWRPGPAEVYSGPAKKALYLMKEQPALFEDAIEDELSNLMNQKEAEEGQSLPSDVKPDTLVLRRRVKEVREKERQRIAMELLYLKVCHNFLKRNVPLIPTMKAGGDFSFSQTGVNLKGLTEIYSQDALEIVKDHLMSILGSHANPMLGTSIIRMSLFQAGQAYLVSSMMGYYVSRVDARYQLGKMVGSLGSLGEEGSELNEADVKTLKDYMENFGPQELQKMTSIASTEASAALEIHVSALFGDLRALKEKLLEAVGMVLSQEEANQKLQEAIENNEVESMKLSSDDLRRLVLEALAFGSLLYDAERQADSFYELTPSSPRMGGPLTDDGPGTRLLP